MVGLIKDKHPKFIEVLTNKLGSRNVPQTEKVTFQSIAMKNCLHV